MLDKFTAVKTTIFGIKCDAAGCGYADMSVSSKEYKSYIGRPCPKCSASLMTPANYRSFRRMVWVIRAINTIAFPILIIRWMLGYSEKSVRVDVDSKPDGSVKFNERTYH